jgi:hypothetical protein
MFKSIGVVISAWIVFSSCEKVISFTPNSGVPTVVVEATIEDGQPPIVILSKSLDYFSEITPELLAGSFINDAQIDVSNGTLTHRLKEYFIETPDGYKLYYYSIDSGNLATAFVGELAKSYSLRINTGGKEYTANTTIPALTKTIDSLWWQVSTNNPDTTQVLLMGRASDPPGFGNYIRYFTSTNGEPFYPGLASVFDDQVVDGKTYSVQVEKGVNRNDEIDFDTYSYFNRGDSVTVKFTNIDKATFDFWRTMEYSYSSIGNPFASPTKVLSNIKGGGLGYFGGYATQYISFVIPE